MDDISIFMQDAIRFPQIPKIPLFMRLEDQTNDDYDPKVVSLGPYHHGKPELKVVEDFKPKALQLFINGSDKDQDFFIEKILEEIEDAKSYFYDMEDTYIDDNAFAQMMLLDACFVLNYIEFVTQGPDNNNKGYTFVWHLGYGVLSLVQRDMFLLENQVPFGILKLLFNLRYGGCGFEEMLKRYSCLIFFGQPDSRNNVLMEPQPSHLFELLRRALVSGSYQRLKQSHRFFKWRKNNSSSNENIPTTTSCPLVFRPMMDLISKCIDRCNKKEGNPMVTKSSDMFHSVMDMKSKGVRFMPSGFGSFKAVRFTSHCYYAKLSLPCWYVSEYTRVFFRNMIAYENCPGNPCDCSVSAYIYFLKTLVLSPNDAKELREKKIIFNHLGSDEEVVQVFRALKTYVLSVSNYKDVKEQIEEHCNRKSQTWIAELLDTYFTSPWSLLALFAATALLFVTLLQTYYASPFNYHAKGS